MSRGIMTKTEEYWLQEMDNAEELYKLFVDILEGKRKIVGTTFDEDTVLVTTREIT